jgi:hypothetical protein
MLQHEARRAAQTSNDRATAVASSAGKQSARQRSISSAPKGGMKSSATVILLAHSFQTSRLCDVTTSVRQEASDGAVPSAT